MYKLVDQFKENAQKKFEENISKSLNESSEQGKKK